MQRAMSLGSDPNDANAQPKFVPFAGSGKRIDGKLLATSSSTSTSTSTATKVSGGVASISPSTSTSALAQTTATSNTTSSASVAPSSASASIPLPIYQSRIGDKFSKKKTAASAFTGTGHKLG